MRHIRRTSTMFRRRVGALFLAISLVLTFLPPAVSHAAPLGVSGYYSAQLEPPGSGVYQEITRLLAAPDSNSGNIPITLGQSLTLSGYSASGHPYYQLADELHTLFKPAFDAVLADHPEIFWVDPVRSQIGPVGNPEDYPPLVEPDGTLRVSQVWLNLRVADTTEQIIALQRELEDSVADFLTAVPAGSRAEQAGWIYDKLIAETTLLSVGVGRGIQSIGPLLEQAAAPAGFAKAFQLLCDRLGIPCVLVSGSWNMVQLENGQWYAVDAAYGASLPSSSGFTGLLLGENTLLHDGTTFGNSHPAGEFLIPPPLSPNAYSMSYRPNGQVSVSGHLVYGEPLDALTLSGDFVTADGTNTHLPGRLTWLDPDLVPNAGSHQAAYRFLPEDPAYRALEGEVTIHVLPRDLPIQTEAGQSRVYNGSIYPDEPLKFGYRPQDAVAGDVFARESFTGRLALASRNAGSQAIALGDFSLTDPHLAGNYRLSMAEGYVCAVEPLTLSEPVIRGVGTQNKTLDNLTEADLAVEFANIRTGDDGQRDQVKALYTAAFSGASPGTAAVTVELTGLTGRDAANYRLPEQTVREVTVPVAALSRERDVAGVIELEAGSGGKRTTRLCPLLGLDAEDALWTDVSAVQLTDDPHNLFLSGGEPKLVSSGDGYLLEYAPVSGLRPGMTAACTFRFTAREVRYTAHVDFSVAEKVLTVDVSPIPDKIYDGAAVPIPAVICRDRTGNTEAPTLAYRYTGRNATRYDSAAPPADAGEYTLVVTVADSGHAFAGTSPPVDFVIRKAQARLVPHHLQAGEGEALPELTYQFTGIPKGVEPVWSPRPQLQCDAPLPLRPGRYTIRLANQPLNRNFTLTADNATLTVSAREGGAALLSAPEPDGENGWHIRPIALAPATDSWFDQIGLSPEGPFGDQVLLGEDTANGYVTVYLRRDDYVSEGIGYSYKLDTTPPRIGGLVYTQTRDAYRGYLTVQAADDPSGISRLTVTGPDGGVLAAEDQGYPVAVGGDYTVEATNQAGQTLSLHETVVIRTIDALTITDEAGTPLNGGGLFSDRLGVLVEGSALPDDYTLRWSSDNPAAISVDQEGRLTTHQLGATVITVQAIDRSAAHSLTSSYSTAVNQPAPGMPSATVPDAALPHGVSADTLRLVMTLPDDDTRQALFRHASGLLQFSGMQAWALHLRLVDFSTGQEVQTLGNITVTLPYQDGYDIRSTYALLQLRGGQAALPAVDATADGVRFSAATLGAFALGYRNGGAYQSNNTSGDGGSTGSGSGSSSGKRTTRDETPPETFWESVSRQIRDAADGTTVQIAMEGRGNAPAQVVQTLHGRSVTAVFADSKQTVTLAGSTLPTLDSAKASYSMADLAALVQAVDAVTVPMPELEVPAVSAPQSAVTPPSGNKTAVETVTPDSTADPEPEEENQTATYYALGEPTDLSLYGENEDFGAEEAPAAPNNPARKRLPLLLAALLLTGGLAVLIRHRLGIGKS